MPDGTVREKRWFRATFQAPDGTVHTEEFTEVVPPLDDGFSPKDLHDVIQCPACTALVCKSEHTFVCSEGCRLTFCVKCRVPVKIGDKEVDLCPDCARQARIPLVIRKLDGVIFGS